LRRSLLTISAEALPVEVTLAATNATVVIHTGHIARLLQPCPRFRPSPGCHSRARVSPSENTEEVCQRGAPFVGLESILFVDPNSWQLLPPERQLVAPPRELFLRLEQLEPRSEPLFTCPGHVSRHRLLSSRRVSFVVRSTLDTIRSLSVMSQI